MYGVHSHLLDFEIIDTTNPKSLVFIDASEYMENPEKPLLEIILPGTKKYLLVNIAPRKVNTFTSNTLGITPSIFDECEPIDLPDGVWAFKYKICPYKYINKIKYYLRTVILTSTLKSVLDKLECDVDIDEDIKREISEIFILIESAKASAELGNKERATNKYSIANKRVNSLFDKVIK